MLGKRRHSRVEVKTGFVRSRQFSAHDLSESGMCLSCNSPVAVGTELLLTLELQGGMTVNAKVMWCREAASIFEQGYRVGVEFSSMSTQDMLIIRAFVQEQSSSDR
ncbi:MAG: PilZ domain-containing protein [Pseudomonadota bacterium]